MTRILASTVVVAAVLAAATPAATLELAVTPPARAVVGEDLVLVLTLTTDEPPLAFDDVEVTAAGDAFSGEPYPLRLLEDDGDAGRLRLEWAAPIPADASPGTRAIELTATGPGGPAHWSGNVEVGFGDDWSDARISAFIESRGLPLFLLLVFGFGVLMSLSPCIYPMIPITLAVIGGQSQDKGVARGLVLSVTYVLGMALVYALIGLVVATVFSGLTAFMQSPWVVGPIAVLLVVLAFGMFGAYELQAPQALRDRLQGPGGGRGGLVGAFVMGMVAGLVASPCVGPFLNALLLVIATTGDWLLGFVSLFVFGLGLGLLLIGVGTFPALLGSLPQAGGWMDTVKRAMGLLLVAMAFWFVRPEVFLPEPVFYPLLGAVTIVVAIFVGAFDGITAESGWWDRTRKGLGIVILVGGLYLLGGAILAHGLLMPPPLAGPQAPPVAVAVSDPAPAAEPTGPSTSAPAKVAWEVVATGDDVQTFLDDRLLAARAQGQPVMVDFWASWCVYCKKLDKDVWNVPDVVAESQRFVTIKIDATAPDDAEMAAIKERWGVAGLPRVIFIDSRGEFLPGRSVGYLPPEKMLAHMRGIR